MHALLLGSVLGCATALWAPAALSEAQSPDYIEAKPDAAAKAFGQEVAGKIFSDAFTSMRHNAVAHSIERIPGFNCPPDPRITLVEVVPYPVKPAAVSWLERYLVNCTPQARRNFMLLLDGEQARIAELSPGATLAEPAQQRDISRAVKAAAQSERPEGCEHTVIADTAIIAKPGAAGASWVELWTCQQCLKVAQVELTFKPTPGGATKWSARLIRDQ